MTPDPSDEERDLGFATDCIHAGQEPDPSTGAVVTPIHPTTTYAQEELGEHEGYEYSRTGNPTRAALEENVAELEGGVRGLAFGSGMAAISAVTHLLEAGDHVVAEENVYGGTHRFFRRILTRYDLTFTFVDASDPANVEEAVEPETEMVFLETPTNPNLKLNPVEPIAEMASDRDLLTVVDNTFASPYLQQPLELGADVVVHSATKYLGGHSDAVGGVVVVDDEGRGEDLHFVQNSVGAILGPFDAWIVLRGVKTLPVRMDRHQENARALAEALQDHPKAASVNYPGLEGHPQHDLAREQMSGYGGMVSFEAEGGLEAGKAVMEAVDVWTLAESLGAVESLISHPASMTHAAIPAEERREAGISDGLVRLSVGIEDVEDLQADLEAALEQL
jgi:cystathionine beta-lyase/cystathionine gamma-synthase